MDMRSAHGSQAQHVPLAGRVCSDQTTYMFAGIYPVSGRFYSEFRAVTVYMALLLPEGRRR